MTDQVRLAFIGCGNIVASHLNQGLKDFEDVDFVGWCDLNRSAAESRRAQANGRGEVFDDAAAMLDTVAPDAVFIALPPYAHGEIENLVIARNLPFFVEKPVAIDLETAHRIYDGVVRHELITSVGYMNRYRTSVQRVRHLLQNQKPVMMHGGWLIGGPTTYQGIWKWWVQKHKSGGQFLEQTTHTTDLARFLFGDVTKVYATAVRDRKPRPSFFTIEDASMVQLSFANGAVANLYSSCSTAIAEGVCLNVWGTHLKATFTGSEHSVEIDLPGNEHIKIPGAANIFGQEDRVFIDSVKAGENRGILATYEDGLKATAIACAANRSMETGEVIDLSL